MINSVILLMYVCPDEKLVKQLCYCLLLLAELEFGNWSIDPAIVGKANELTIKIAN